MQNRQRRECHISDKGTENEVKEKEVNRMQKTEGQKKTIGETEEERSNRIFE